MRKQQIATWAILMGGALLGGCSALIDTSDYEFCDEDDDECDRGAVEPVDSCEAVQESLSGQWTSGCIVMQTPTASGDAEDYPQELVYTYTLDDDCTGEVVIDHFNYLPNDDNACEVEIWVEQQIHEVVIDPEKLQEVPLPLALTVKDFRMMLRDRALVMSANMPNAEGRTFLDLSDWRLNEWQSLLGMVVDSEDLTDTRSSRAIERGGEGHMFVESRWDDTYRFSPPRAGDASTQSARELWDYVFTAASGRSIEERL